MITVLWCLGILAYAAVVLFFAGYLTGLNENDNEGRAPEGWLYFLAVTWPLMLVLGSIVAGGTWLLDKGLETATGRKK